MIRIFLVLACVANLWSNSMTPSLAQQSIVLGDRQNYWKERYGAFASPWSANTEVPHLLQGKDFDNKIEVTPAKFPDSTSISWRWPDHPPVTAGVYGYMHLFFGNYDGGIPPVPVPSVQVKHVVKFTQEVKFQGIQGDAEAFNVLNEFWLTRDAGQHEEKSSEIGIMLQTNAKTRAFMDQGEALGPYSDEQGRSWDVVVMPGAVPFIVFASSSSKKVQGKLDLKAMLSFLMKAGPITGEEWINGVALGVEPHFGSGILRVEHWNVDLR